MYIIICIKGLAVVYSIDEVGGGGYHTFLPVHSSAQLHLHKNDLLLLLLLLASNRSLLIPVHNWMFLLLLLISR